MKRIASSCALLLACAGAQAADGLSLGIGADYSSGKYGTATTTEIWSIPLSARYTQGDWTFKASLPWLRVDGDASVLPGIGGVLNSNPRGRGRLPVVGGSPAPAAGSTSGSASGIGDLRLAATYALPTSGPLGIDLTANAKVATADADKGLGTGEHDVGLAVDLYRDFDGTLVFGGVGYTVTGDSAYLQLDDVANANIGTSWSVGGGNLGVMYDWRQSPTAGYDDRSELTGFYGLKAGDAGKLQLYASKGLSDGSPDWGVGINFTRAF